MSSKDKTREKLMGSMRKTKAAAGLDTNGKAMGSAEVSPDLPDTGQAKPTPKSTPRRAAAKVGNVQRDAYQSGRRVWPD
jgi:hypothetical protein